MRKQTSQLGTNTTWLRYSFMRRDGGALKQFDITVEADAPRGYIARKLWHEVRGAMRGTTPTRFPEYRQTY